MAEFLRPISIRSTTGFTGAATDVDEVTRSDADYVYGATGAGNVIRFNLSAPSVAPNTGNLTVRYAVAKVAGGGALDGGGATVEGQITIQTPGGTVLASDVTRTLTGTWTEYSFTFPYTAISDYNNVVLGFTDGASHGGNPGNRRAGALSWVEVELPASLPAITGDLVVQETGTDTFASTGTVSDPPVSGDLIVQETGTDTLASTANVLVSGNGTLIEGGSDSFVGSGTVKVSGSLIGVEGGTDSLSSVSKVIVGGDLVVQESGQDVFAGTGGTPKILGNLVAQESGSDTLTSTSKVIVAGDLAAQESGSDVLSGTGSVPNTGISGNLVAQEAGQDVASATGTVLVSGNLVSQEAGQDSSTITGTVLVSGDLVSQETGSDTFSATGGANDPAINGNLVAQESGVDTFNSTAKAIISVVGSVQETGEDSASATGTVKVLGNMVALEIGQDNFSANGQIKLPLITGDMVVREVGVDKVGSQLSKVKMVNTQWPPGPSLSVQEQTREIEGLKNLRAGVEVAGASPQVIASVRARSISQAVNATTARLQNNRKTVRSKKVR